MRVFHDLPSLGENFRCSIATIGNFDGLHLGHREILSRVKARSMETGCPSLVITFEPHPSSILYPTRGISRITSPEKKIALIGECGMDAALVLEFTLAFSQKDFREFVEDILIPLRLRELYVGHDFSFGAGRKGNVAALAREGEVHGFRVFEIKEVSTGENIRSSRIREHIAEGNVAKAAEYLTRPHSVSGTVIKGAGRGKALGFPTANLGGPRETVPGPGIYATRTLWNGMLYDSATHVGAIPTFDVDVPGIETHIFDFSRDIQGEKIEVHFVERIRGVIKFDSVDALRRQIAIDCEEAKKILRKAG